MKVSTNTTGTLTVFRALLALLFGGVVVFLFASPHAQGLVELPDLPSAGDIIDQTEQTVCDVEEGVSDVTDITFPTPDCDGGGSSSSSSGGSSSSSSSGGGGEENNPPVITLNGESTITLTVGDMFTDPGATASDVEDGDLTGSIVVGGDTVDTGTPGTYTVIYSVTDSDAATDEVSLTVIVEEVTENGGGSSSGGSSNTGSSGGGSSARKATASGAIDQCVPYLNEYIRLGASNNSVEVLKLQQFLHNEEGFENVLFTGVYDDVTLEAVNAFQQRHATDILGPWGAPQSTGYVYFTTQKKINEIHCKNTLQFALTLEQLAEIEAIKALQSGGGTDAPAPNPSNAQIGSNNGVGEGLADTTPEESDSPLLVEERTGTQAASVAESSFGKFFRGIGGGIRGIFQAIF